MVDDRGGDRRLPVARIPSRPAEVGLPLLILTGHPESGRSTEGEIGPRLASNTKTRSEP